MARSLIAGRYHLTDRLGQGGTATVYRAIDLRLDRPVAVKIVRLAGLADADLAARLLAEARTVAALTHPHIVAVYDAGQDGDLVYLVLEYLPGSTLRERLLRQGRQPLAEALTIARDVLQGLAAAHAAGLVHCDLKPENILFAADGTAKIADFGIARTLAERPAGDRTLWGTPAYLAPEQIRGQAVGPATDLYALGVILFEMLTGQPPFRGPDPASVLRQHLTAPPPPLHPSAAGIPPSVAALIARALAKDPRDRWPEAGAMLRAVDQALAASAQPTVPLGPAARTGEGQTVATRPRRRSWPGWLLLGGTILGLVAGSLLALRDARGRLPALPVEPVASPTPVVVRPTPTRAVLALLPTPTGTVPAPLPTPTPTPRPQPTATPVPPATPTATTPPPTPTRTQPTLTPTPAPPSPTPLPPTPTPVLTPTPAAPPTPTAPARTPTPVPATPSPTPALTPTPAPSPTPAPVTPIPTVGLAVSPTPLPSPSPTPAR